MFDIGFWELATIAVVALLVVGPERLPGLARTAGLWLGRGRRFLSSVKDDIDKELRAEEIKQVLQKPGELEEVYDVLNETRASIDQAGNAIEADDDKSSADAAEIAAAENKNSDSPATVGVKEDGSKAADK